jgi:hypothetical protein
VAPLASESPSESLAGTPSAEPSKKPHKGKHKGRHRKTAKHAKSMLRKGLEKVVPGLDKIPDWALPIVFDADKHKAPDTTIAVRMDNHGNLVINAKIEHTGIGLLSIGYHSEPVIDDTVWVRIVVQDPTEATEETPTTITVTAIDPVTDEVSTATAEVTAPEDVADTVTETIDDATAEASANV